MDPHIIPHQHIISSSDRIQKYGHKPYLIWLTGLSGSGKSTLASRLEWELFQRDHHTYILDGDNVRSGLNKDLDFTEAHRQENIRRIAEVAKLFLDAGVTVITAFISPFEEDRAFAKEIVGKSAFIEVFIDTPLHICEERDVKGLYAKARAGTIKHFTGIDSPFEAPKSPDVHITTADKSVEASTAALTQSILNIMKQA